MRINKVFVAMWSYLFLVRAFFYLLQSRQMKLVGPEKNQVVMTSTELKKVIPWVQLPGSLGYQMLIF
ncbi:hypothetical protein BJD16_04810 [Aeromonas sobria]|uniref:Uncharacterized protein n=1 Tax=Aeromonas sobria TaxID=646 RepID=A0A1S2CT90_AERSO|nr:hypothetical protein BJD16_04810 [Aeromonas sobria]